MKNKSKYIIIFFIGLIFGFSVLLFRNVYEGKTGEVKSHWNTIQLEEGDSKNYFDRALALSQGKSYEYGFESAPIVAYSRTPVYSFFLALIFLVFGVSLKAVIVLQIIITSLIVCLISAVSKLIFNETISWISGFLTILYYPMWNSAVQINCELLSMFIGLLSFYYILKYYYSQKNVLKYLLLSGVFAGLTALTRGQYFYYSFLYLIFILSVPFTVKYQKIKLSLLWFLVLLTPILLWSLYSYIVSGIFVFISSHGSFQIFLGWSPIVVLDQQYPVWNPLWDSNIMLYKGDNHAVYLPSKSTFWFINEALKFIFEYPVESIQIAYFKLLDSWGLITFFRNESIITKLFKAFKYNWDFLLAIPAWIILWKKKENKIFYLYVFFACIIYTLISLMTVGLVRYRFPYLDPLLIILASYTLFKIYESIKIKKSKNNI